MTGDVVLLKLLKSLRIKKKICLHVFFFFTYQFESYSFEHDGPLFELSLLSWLFFLEREFKSPFFLKSWLIEHLKIQHSLKKNKWKFCYCMFAIPTVNAQYRCQVLTWSCTHIHSKVSEFLMVMPSREVSIFSCVFSGKTLNNFIYVNSWL